MTLPERAVAAALSPAASAPEGWIMIGQGVPRLTRSYALLLAALAIPLLLFVAALALHQLADQRRALVTSLAGKAHEERLALAPILDAAVDHVLGLKELMEDRLAGRLRQPEAALRRELRAARHPDGMEGVFLDSLAGTPLAQAAGNVLGDSALLQRPPAEMVELDAALDLFVPMWTAHMAAPQLRWSYYLSARGDLMTMFPFAPSSEFIAQSRYTTMSEMIAGWLGYDVFVDGTPARDPAGAPYWTGPYQDAGGAGWMVSHAAPVYAGGRFMGVIGTDILLSSLQDFLRAIDWPVGQVWIVDHNGRVLAARDPTQAAGDGTATLAELLPAPLAEVPMAELLAPRAGFATLAGHAVMAEPVSGTPYALLYVVPQSAITWLILPRLVPYALILVGLVLTLLAAFVLLQRRVVGPALALVRHIQDESQGVPGRSPARVPAQWRPWFAAVTEAFTGSRHFQTRLAESEARLRAAAESIPDGLAIYDSDDRLVFFNSRYPQHMTTQARSTLALGKRWADWVREAAALGPVYHPEMGEEAVEARIAARGRGEVDREHRLIDGRWVRVRSNPMPGGGHVHLTADLTAERQQRQERTLVATAMGQVGDSIEIATTDYRLVYVNPAFTRLTGYTAEEALGRTPGELLRSDAHPPEFYEEIDRHSRAGEVWQGQIISRHKSGRLLYQDATVSPIYDEAGTLAYLVCAKRDVSDRIRAEAALEESRRTHAAVLEAALDCFVSIDEGGRIIEFNPAAERTFGYSLEEVRGRELHTLIIPPELREAHVAGLARYLATGATRILGRRLELTALRKDGATIPIELVVAATRHEDRPAFTAYMRDLSEQKRTEAALRASEARFLAAASSMPDGLVILDPEDRIVFYNSRHPELLPPALRETLRLGVRFGDWIRESLARGPVYHPDMGPDYAAGRLAGRDPDLTEREHKHADGRWVRIREARMGDGGRVLLTTDITARRDAETRFLAAAESIPDGLAIFDADDRFVFYNSRYPDHVTANMREVLRLGIGFDEWMGAALALGPVYHPDMGEDYVARRMKRRGQDQVELEHKVIDGRWIRIRESRMPDGGRVLLTTDVTERRRRQQQLSLLAMAVDQVGDQVEIADASGRCTYVNPAFARLTGYQAAEVVGRRVRDVLLSGRHDALFFDTIDECLKRGGTWQGRVVNRRKDGELIHQDTTISPLRDRDGRITHFVAVKRDVTEQDKAEAAIRASEARYRAVVDTQREFIARIGADGRLSFVNDAYCRYYGQPRENLLGRSFNEFTGTLPEDRERDAAHLQALTPADPSRIIELRRQRSDGRICWVQWADTALFDDDGRLIEIQSVGRDITEQRNSELALRASEASYRALVETQTEFVLRLLPDGRVTFVNEAYCRYVSTSREAILANGWNDLEVVAPEDRAAYDRHLKSLTPKHPTAAIEIRAILPDGSERWEAWVDTGLFDREGRLSEIQSVGRDVTERKRTELALRESEARYRALVETQTEFVLRQLPEGRLTFVNEAYCRYIGRSRDELLAPGFNGLDMMAPEYRPKFEEHLRRLTPEDPTASMETRAILPDGTERWEWWVDTGIFDARGRLVELQSTGRDVTEQKRSELALRTSEMRYRAVVEGQSEFILRVRPNGSLTFVNDAYCRYRGLSREQMLGGFNDVYHYPPEEQAKIHAAWASLTPDFPSCTYELTKPGADGQVRWEEWTDTAIFAPTGRVTEYQAIGRDITERKLVEQSLTESEARFRLIAESVPLPIAITAVDRHCILFINAMGREVFGVETGTTDQAAIESTWVDLDNRAEVARRIASEGGVEQAEVRMRRRDGSEFAAIMSARPLSYGGERAVLGVITDITERRRTEEALRESEARLAALMEHAPLVVHLKDRDGRYLLANPESAKIFGCAPKAVIGRTAAEVFPPAEAALIDRHTREVLETGRAQFHEEFQPSLSDYQWSMVIRFPIRDAHGEITVVGCFALDITRSKLAEAEVKASALRFRTIADIHPTPMIVTRLDDREVLFANRAYHEVFGVDERALAEFDRSSLYVNPGEREEIYAGIERGQRFDAREIAMRTAKGVAFPAMLSARAIDYEGSRGCIMSFLDLSALKQAEAALRASEQRFRGIAEAHPMPLVIVRARDGRLRFANEPFRQLFRLEGGGLETADPKQFYAQPADRLRFLRAMQEGGGVDGLEQLLLRRDGTTFPAATTSRMIEYEGEPAFVTSVVDLTERRATESEMQRQRENLHQSEKLAALGALLAGVAHELNNPLSVVVGYASMLKELAQDEATRTRAGRVHAAAERCARIVKTFLAMARSRPPQRGAVQLEEVVENALDLAGYGLRTAGVEIVRELDPDLPQVWGDSDQLHQVITNLIVNAQQALTQTSGARRLRLRTLQRDGEVLLEVEDNGPGMTPEVEKRIFEPFFTTKPQGVGTGVGLSVCLGIVTAHEGRITVRSEPGHGTCFTVALPLHRDAVAHAAHAAPPEAMAPAPGRVLVVDDEPEIAELVAEHLRRDGLTVEIVSSGRKALARLKSQSFDVVVSDLRMPDLDGRALVGALREQHPELARKVVLITGDALGADFGDVSRELSLPVFEKPLDIGALRGQVRRFLEAA